MARNYKNLEVWKLSYDLTLDFYKITEKFPEHEMNNIISQIRRASSSVPLNIAEGCSRHSKKAFLQFLMYAYGSARELQVLLMLSKDLKYIELNEYEIMEKKLDRLSGKLFLFLRNVEDSKFYDWFKK